MITKEEIKEAISLITSARVYLAKMDRNATKTQSYRLNQAFSHIEKAEDFINRLGKSV